MLTFKVRMSKAPTSKRPPKIVGLIFTVGSLLFILIGIGISWHQGSLLWRCQPVSATITSTRIDNHRSTGKHSRTLYRPIVEFTYRVGDVQHQGTQPKPLRSETSSHAAAQAIIDCFHAGQEVTAWVDPRDPSSSFLIREADISPYLFILFPMLHGSFGLMLLLTLGRTDACEKERGYRIIALVWWLVGIGVAAHYTSCYGPWTWTPITALSIYGAIGLGWLYVWLRAKRATA